MIDSWEVSKILSPTLLVLLFSFFLFLLAEPDNLLAEPGVELAIFGSCLFGVLMKGWLVLSVIVTSLSEALFIGVVLILAVCLWGLDVGSGPMIDDA